MKFESSLHELFIPSIHLLRAFHNFVWKNGNVPIALQRWELLGEGEPGQ